ncbi:MAG: BREX-2 system adenine-specific DNA-methyltransferase PglX, partial [Deltaproteobacteria bacterium]|nr:BREX-2 system adenine-specific DNA-methyltransferase PglX [Deltaproteobacteria bacterium]
MATRKKKAKAEALTEQRDPRAPLDAPALVASSRKVLKLLDEDLLKRASASASVRRALAERHRSEVEAKRTGDGFEVWMRNFVGQVGAAWLLSCVFVRTLEDRGLLGQARLAGPGALDSQRLFFEMAPSLTERDYLLFVFRELTRLLAARDLFDARHNPVWMLAPSAEAARALLALFREPTAEAPALRFGQSDTRFLGDLYQDLDEDVQKRYALLQTPHFIESFILDRTLEPVIERFGLDETTLIDPTCGSGHFLLGAFERFFEHRLRKAPGLDRRVVAQEALNAVFGADINPYAIAIARFRLTLAFLEKGGFTKLAAAPSLPIHLACADSLLHNPQHKQLDFGDREDVKPKEWRAADIYALEDEAAARDVLHRRYAAVVGNPPYITVKDAVLRERYRDAYVSAAGKYSLAAPFMERFFQLGRDAASIGMITANSFMKREFGKKLIEQYLPTVNLELVINTSGAYIPGHGTPTVLIFGTTTAPQASEVHAVLASRGEPSTPDDPEQGQVWRSIADHWSQLGFENEYITVSRVERARLAKHPWSLGGGGAAELKELLEERAEKYLQDLVSSIGFMAITGEDEVFVRPREAWLRAGAEPEWVLGLVAGEDIRDWSISPTLSTFFPYRHGALNDPGHYPSAARVLWPYRRLLLNRPDFGGKKYIDVGRPWYSYHQVPLDRFRTRLSIAFAFVATHNHFVLDRGGKVFNRSAPIIKLPETATEDDHLALLAYLNSSTACFWMKQVFFEKSSQNYVGDVRDKPERIHYEFAGTGLEALPIPKLDHSLANYARMLLQLAEMRGFSAPEHIAALGFEDADELKAALVEGAEKDALALREMVALQEALDWHVYKLFSLADDTDRAEAEQPRAMDPQDRPFLLSTARGSPFPSPEVGAEVRQLEQPMFKRPWLGTQGVFHRDAWSYNERAGKALLEIATSQLEAICGGHPGVISPATIILHTQDVTGLSSILELLCARRSASSNADQISRSPWFLSIGLQASMLRWRSCVRSPVAGGGGAIAWG